jgi:hypothetical protein
VLDVGGNLEIEDLLLSFVGRVFVVEFSLAVCPYLRWRSGLYRGGRAERGRGVTYPLCLPRFPLVLFLQIRDG